MLNALMVVTLVVTGVMVGVEFAVAVFVNPMLNSLPSESCLAANRWGGRVLGKVMPFWYVASLALGAVWAGFTWGQSRALPVIVGAALLVASVVLSLVVLVPITTGRCGGGPRACRRTGGASSAAGTGTTTCGSRSSSPRSRCSRSRPSAEP